MLGETVAHAAVSPHLYITSYTRVRRYLPFHQLHSRLGDFSIGVCHVMKITIAEINPDLGLFTQQTLSPTLSLA